MDAHTLPSDVETMQTPPCLVESSEISQFSQTNSAFLSLHYALLFLQTYPNPPFLPSKLLPTVILHLSLLPVLLLGIYGPLT